MISRKVFVSLLTSFGQVSDVWDEIITQDKKASHRRKAHLKELKRAHEVKTAGLLYNMRMGLFEMAVWLKWRLAILTNG